MGTMGTTTFDIRPRPITWARSSVIPPGFVGKPEPPPTTAQRRGLRYEARWHLHAIKTFPAYRPNPWFMYRERGHCYPHWCQPDGLIQLPNDRIVVVELKHKFTRFAAKLWEVYVPVVRQCFPKARVNGLLILRWFDPAECPDLRPAFVPSPYEAVEHELNFMLWKD